METSFRNLANRRRGRFSPTLPSVSKVERWERRAEVPLILLAVAFLVAYAWPVLDPRMDPGLRSFFTAVSWTVYAAFALDVVIRLTLAEERGRYALAHWYDLALVTLPVLRPLRLLRLVAVVRILDRSAGNSFAERAVVYMAGAAAMGAGLGSLAVLDAEQDSPHSNITHYGDALWWAAETVTTVGYGDFYPVTPEGRMVAVVLMVIGIGLVGTVTAAVAAWFVRRTATEKDDAN
jgi:voltage-gated potassium channel